MDILLGLSILPGALICWFIYAQDKHDKEPHKWLALCGIFGAISTIPAIFMELFGEQFLFRASGIHTEEELVHHIVPTFFYAMVVVAFSEELVKFLILRFYIYNKKAFNEPFDGITYAVMISMGFATLENVLYVAGGGLGVAILRMFTAVPGHAAFAVVMGYYAGLAKFGPKNKEVPMLLTGFLGAVVLHGLYDFFLFQQNFPALALLALVVLVIGVVFSLRLIKKHQKNSPFSPENGGDGNGGKGGNDLGGLEEYSAPHDNRSKEENIEKSNEGGHEFFDRDYRDYRNSREEKEERDDNMPGEPPKWD